ncbi:DUF362 domain-containing protein [bacterium]|nr:DUF362 domain-containing protein [bacterium]
MKARVALLRCDSYNETAVDRAVERGLEMLGGADAFVKPGEQILLKPNLLVPELPKKCVTTHPSVFRAVAKVLQANGAVLSYGDSPAVGSTLRAARKAGIHEVAEAMGIPIADFKTGVEIFFEAGHQNRKFVIAQGVLDSDGVVSLPKLKTHALERFTGCVKNQFGCVPGILKGEYHVKLPDPNDFGKMLVDLNCFIHPRLYVMDGITAMEGNGPRGGTPRQMNLLLFSADPVALDATVCRLVNMNPENVPTIRFGQEFGAGTYLEDAIELVGDPFDDFLDREFKIERRPVAASQSQGFVRWINNRLVPKPVIAPESCTCCGTCVQMCPVEPKALHWKDGDQDSPPVYDYGDCIRCYCCQELCPESAIRAVKPPLRRLLDLLPL